jgi:hypothetical protein
MFRELDAPNPLSFVATGWATGHTKLGEAEFLSGVGRGGKKWSVLVGSAVLKKRLVDGLIEKWDDQTQSFQVVKTLGRVQPGEYVSIKYTGDRQGEKYEYPAFEVVRKPADEDGIPF